MAMNHSQKKRLENVWEALKHDKIAIFSIIFLALILILSLLAPVLPLEPNKTDVAHMLEAPSSAHIFGTDEVGRDYLARVIYGGRVSLLVGVLAMLMSVTIGVTVGILAGYLGGIIDGILAVNGVVGNAQEIDSAAGSFGNLPGSFGRTPLSAREIRQLFKTPTLLPRPSPSFHPAE